MTDVKVRKQAARKQAFAARAVAHAMGLDQAACAHLLRFFKALPAFSVVSGYMPIRSEINPLPVMAALHDAGKTVCVPVIEAAGKPLKFSRWQPSTKMLKGAFGAMIPATEDFLDPDILITPLLAFDARGYRLGYGGGYYDRSFARLRGIKPVTGVGFAYGAQEVGEVPTEPTDQRLDALVSETGITRF